jgi:hypothetical protein
MAMNPKTAVFRRLKQNLSTDKHERAAGNSTALTDQFSLMIGDIKCKKMQVE